MMSEESSAAEPTRAELSQMEGPVVVEFGASWCGHCQALRPVLRELLKAYPQVRHLKVEDGKGRPLGRSFRVTLWPTLVCLRDGVVQQQLVRPGREEVREALEELVSVEQPSQSE